ncbi:ATP-binding cassette domain-containing protein [bacterium]|nr:ATP-binding cassette domain-containing protein [bacterium]
MASQSPVVEIRDLTKLYGEFMALDALTLSVDRGTILGFIGHNGAGKTTTIRILVGLARPTSGTATIAGADCVREARRVKQLVGYMPDRFGSYSNMRVREYLDFFGAAFGIKRRVRNQRIDEVLDITGSRYMQDRYVEALSHGMQQRIGIARTLLHQPEVLILDEPANGLDPQARIEMREILLRLADLGKTLIVTSHILPELARICSQVAILHRGKLQACGSLEEVTRQFQQNRMIEVELAAADQIELAVGVLGQQNGHCDEIVPSPAESIVRFRSGKRDAELGHVLAALVQANVRVTQFREVASNLEEAYLTVTRSHDGDRPAVDVEPLVDGGSSASVTQTAEASCAE